MAITFFDRTQGAPFPVTKEHAAARDQLGKTIHAAIVKALDNVGAFITPAKTPDNPTENQLRRIAKNGVSNMVALTIPLPSLTVEMDGGTKVSTKPTILNVNAILKLDGETDGETVDAVVEAPKALTYDALKAMQLASRKLAHK